ncbi:MAG: glycerol-3-phosphate acyltransferase [Candidatus Tyloplasma litorale]|nr:MAG: glycerol-3-phosphate acyltransferase [Mycoplasmatales bacterium]
MEFNQIGHYWYSGMFIEPSFWIGSLIFCFIAYIIGSINSAQILSIAGSKNIGETGSRNFGATNAGRAYGVKGFVFVFLFDMLKAVFVAIILTMIATKGTFDLNSIDPNYLFAYASIPGAIVFVIIGHSFPIFFGFKGGKGVATAFGSIIVLNWIFAIIAISVFLLTIKYMRWVSLGSIFGTIVGSMLVCFAHPFLYTTCPNLFFYWTFNWISSISSLFVCLFVIVRHRSNIIRIYQGKDPLIKPKGYVPSDVIKQ